jgi:hypothetical protein
MTEWIPAAVYPHEGGGRNDRVDSSEGGGNGGPEGRLGAAILSILWRS